MEITIKQLLGIYNCSYQYIKVEVEKYTSFRGYDIYADADGWCYVQINGDWRYFATIYECKRFIKDIYTDN